MEKPSRSIDPNEPPSLSWCVKRGIAYGLALGMLVGLIYLAVARAAPVQEVNAIIVWRNFILAGGLIGGVAGAVVGVYRRSKFEQDDSLHDQE